ncbi:MULTISPECIES: ATP-binding protein [unclassified Nocardioides]|uniref:sensor histidine kinase n=1 Tax=unclassified Nocardioides TaxID=2615069 RepID=UPI002406A8A7|nr:MULTISPECIES: ATP-binding protein [unclassified Nocardioides]
MGQPAVAGRRPAPTWPLSWPWALAWATVVAGLTLLGRLTAVEPGAPSLVVPSTGFAVLWMLSRDAGWRSPDWGLLLVCLAAVSIVTGLPPAPAAALVAGAMVQVVLSVVLLRRWSPRTWGVAGGDEPVGSVAAMARVVGAVVVGGVVGGAVAALGLAIEGDAPDLVGLGLLLGRGLAGGIFVVPPLLVIGRAVAVRRPRASDEGGRLELVALLVVTALLYLAAFLPEGLPLAFPLLVVTAWAALRFPTAVAAAHGVGAGITVVLVTLADHGPFAGALDPRVGAVLAQLFVCVVIVSGLVLGVGRDERRALLLDVRRAEAAALEQTDLLRTIIDTMHEGVLVVEGDGAVVLRNPAAGSLEPRDESSSVRDAAGRVLSVDQMPYRRALDGEDVRGSYVLRLPADDADVFIEVAATPLPRSAALPPRAVMVVRDVTQQELQRRELTAFAGVVAHDLKNPLAVVDGWIEVLADELEEGGVPPRRTVEQTVDKVRTASGRMQSLIRHLLQHATSRDAALDLEDVDVAVLADEVVAGRDAADRVEVGPAPRVHGDAAMLRQLLENLVGNALKYVVPGEVAHVRVDGEAAGDGMVAVRVTDNGVGIPDEAKDLVFQQFYRAHAGSVYSGTGLGLAICRRIVDRHGGTITVSDNPAGRGTRIEVLLPAAETPGPGATTP